MAFRLRGGTPTASVWTRLVTHAGGESWVRIPTPREMRTKITLRSRHQWTSHSRFMVSERMRCSMLLWRRLPGSVWLMGILVVLATCVTADAVSRGASASAPEPMFVDFTSSNPIGPGMTLTLTANLPATLRFDDGDGVIQTVDLLGATLNVTTSSDSLVNNYYKAVTITQLTGNVGSFVVGGVHFDGAQFSSVEPGKASINYSRGVLMA